MQPVSSRPPVGWFGPGKGGPRGGKQTQEEISLISYVRVDKGSPKPGKERAEPNVMGLERIRVPLSVFECGNGLAKDHRTI